MATSNTDDEQLRSTLRHILQLNEANHELRRLVGDVTSDKFLIATVIRYYEAHQEINLMVACGPSVHLVDYLVELDRLDDVQKYFRQINADDDEQKHLGKTFNLGLQRLIEESERVITHYSTPVEPEMLLHWCGSTANESAYTDVLKASELGTFRIIFDWLKERGFQQGLLDLYASTRSYMIRSSLQRLPEHLGQKPARRASFSTLSVSPHPVSPRSPFHTDMLREHMKAKIIRFRHRVERSPVFRHRERSSSRNTSLLSPNVDNHLDISDTDELSVMARFDDQQEANNYKFLLDALVILLIRESDLIFYVFPDEFRSLILAKLIESAMIDIQEEAQQFCSAITELPNKIYIGKDAFHGLVAIIRWFHKPKPKLEQFYKESELLPQKDLDHTLLPIFANAIMEYLRSVLVELRNDSAAISPGGQVHPLTIHVLDFIVEYLDCEHIIVKVQQNLKAASSTVDSESLDLSTYVADLYRMLCMHIFNKIAMSVRHDDSIIRAIFLLNNASYILNRLGNSFLSATMEKIQPNLKSHLEDHMQKSIHTYATCCVPVVTAMQQMFHYDDLHHLSADRLRDADREQLKANFMLVNAAIDALRRQNQQFIVDDVQVRDQLRAESKKLLLGVYKAYYTKFAHKPFTRNPEKYIRYTPDSLENIIENLLENC